MANLKNIISLVLVLMITASSAALYPCIGWFNINEYTKEVSVIKDYMVKWTGASDHTTNKLTSWLEQRVAHTDISPDCLKAIAHILSDQNMPDDKKIKKLHTMMQHDKMTRTKDQIALIKQELENSKSTLNNQNNEIYAEKSENNRLRNELFQAQRDLELAKTHIFENTSNKFLQKAETQRQQAQNNFYIRLAKQTAAMLLGMMAIVTIVTPVLIAPTTYADALVNFYLTKWHNKK